MKCTVKRLWPLRIFHFNFVNSYEMNMTFLRLQEFYESPKFHNKFFTLEEYMDWYVKKFYPTEETIGFTYLSWTAGINVPGHIVEKFFECFGSDLRDKEIWLRDILTRLKIEFASNEEVGSIENKPFYLIATYGKDPEAIDHEIYHALYYLLPKYKREVNKIVYKTNPKKLFNALIKNGYAKNVLADEAHAYALDDWPSKFKPTKKYEQMQKELRKTLKQFKDVVPCVK